MFSHLDLLCIVLSLWSTGIQTIGITKHEFINLRDVLYQERRTMQGEQKLLARLALILSLNVKQLEFYFIFNVNITKIEAVFDQNVWREKIFLALSWDFSSEFSVFGQEFYI